MILLTEISNEPNQTMKVRLDNGKVLTLNLMYRENSLAWFLDFEYLNYKSGWIRISNCLNIIRQVKNTLRIGLRCEVDNQTEAWFIDDFITGRAKLYVLNSDDVNQIEETIYVKV